VLTAVFRVTRRFANPVAKPSTLINQSISNTVLENAMPMLVGRGDFMDDLKIKVFNYRLAMNIANRLYHQGILSRQEYDKIDTIMTKKYGLSLCSVFRDKEPYLLDNNTL